MEYKAWDFERRQMCQVMSIVLSDLNGRCKGEIELNNGYVTFWKNHLHNECKLLESAGEISDKNGKDIFFNDIVSFERCHWIVKFGKYVATCETPSYPYKIYAYGWFVESLDEHKSQQPLKEGCEVIGNSYENPELLKTKEESLQVLLDIEQMPGYEFKEGFKGVKSITESKVFLKKFEAGIYPSCYRHGAILCIAKRQDGDLWRCREIGYEEGCFIPKILQK